MIIQFPVRVTGWAAHSEAEINGVLEDTVRGINLENYQSKIDTLLEIHDAGFEIAALQQAVPFLSSLNRAAMRCQIDTGRPMRVAAVKMAKHLLDH